MPFQCEFASKKASQMKLIVPGEDVTWTKLNAYHISDFAVGAHDGKLANVLSDPVACPII